jgi:hypothetical protein
MIEHQRMRTPHVHFANENSLIRDRFGSRALAHLLRCERRLKRKKVIANACSTIIREFSFANDIPPNGCEESSSPGIRSYHNETLHIACQTDKNPVEFESGPESGEPKSPRLCLKIYRTRRQKGFLPLKLLSIGMLKGVSGNSYDFGSLKKEKEGG